MTDVSETLNSIFPYASADTGTMILERVFQEVLKHGFDALSEDTSLIDEILFKLDKATRSTIKDYIAGRHIPVYLNIPIDDVKFPMIAVSNVSDTENSGLDVLGDLLGDEEYTGGSEVGVLYGHVLDSRYNVLFLAGRDSNAALWLYYLAKAVLLINRDSLHEHGVHNLTMSGQDITFREDFLPEFTFSRVLSLSCTNYFGVRKTERVASRVVVSLSTELPFSPTTNSL